jgi:hypothetical protein
MKNQDYIALGQDFQVLTFRLDLRFEGGISLTLLEH